MAERKKSESTEHSAGGVTTRSDALDLGVSMLAGDASEPVGPEDALGPGKKRGDYSKRLGDANYDPHTTERIPDAKPGESQVRIVAQAERASNQGEEKGKKGGVETS